MDVMVDVCVLELQPPSAMQCLRHDRRPQSGAIRDCPHPIVLQYVIPEAVLVANTFPAIGGGVVKKDPVGA